ncbi:MAG: hypothetical protein IPF56_06865 [Chloroflexi bacterium]|nr:hypothetical protein [Chloroflexota bacterium]
METSTTVIHVLQRIWLAARPFLLALILCLSITIYWLDSSATPTRSHTLLAQTAVTPTDPFTLTDTLPAYGVNHISFPAAQPTGATRYANGLATGAAWNRWPMYWSNIEQTPGVFSWAYQDAAVIADIGHGLKLDAILLGTPDEYFSPATSTAETASSGASAAQPTSPFTLNEIQSGTPIGLYNAVFQDGSDTPGPGKAINPANVWARFVDTAVSRYKPGGLIAQQQGWPAGVGVTHWEMWNEPDLLNFWDGTTADYARLLKVGYLAAKNADPNAQIIFGGLAVVYNPYDIPFLSSVLAIYDQDPTAVQFNYFHDILALHNYSYAYRSWRAVYIAGRRLAARNLTNAIWLNETGVPVWDDYPGPICEPNSPYRATMTEQADFIIQSTLYAAYAGAENIFFFQLYDDCGNVALNPPYFPPELSAGAVRLRSAAGLRRGRVRLFSQRGGRGLLCQPPGSRHGPPQSGRFPNIDRLFPQCRRFVAAATGRRARVGCFLPPRYAVAHCGLVGADKCGANGRYHQHQQRANRPAHPPGRPHRNDYGGQRGIYADFTGGHQHQHPYRPAHQSHRRTAVSAH